MNGKECSKSSSSIIDMLIDIKKLIIQSRDNTESTKWRVIRLFNGIDIENMTYNNEFEMEFIKPFLEFIQNHNIENVF